MQVYTEYFCTHASCLTRKIFVLRLYIFLSSHSFKYDHDVSSSVRNSELIRFDYIMISIVYFNSDVEEIGSGAPGLL